MARVGIYLSRNKEYTPEQRADVKLEIKRINTQIRAVGKKYGTDSEVYKSVIAPFVADKYLSDPSRLVHTSKSGYIQIKESASLLESKTGRTIIMTGRNVYTSISELETEARKEVAEEIESGKFGKGLKGKELQQAIQQEVKERTAANRSINARLEALKEYVYGKYTDNQSKKILKEISTGKGEHKQPTRDKIVEMLDRLEPQFGLNKKE